MRGNKKKSKDTSRGFVRYIILIFILIFAINFYLSKNYIFLSGNTLQSNHKSIYDGDDVDVSINEKIVFSTNKLFGPFINRRVQINDLTNVDVVYNFFKFEGLEPYKEYNVDFEMKLSGLNENTNLIIGTQTENPSIEVVDNKTLNNVNLENLQSVPMGFSDKLTIPLNFQANEEGEINIAVGIEVDDVKTLDFVISHVRIHFE